MVKKQVQGRSSREIFRNVLGLCTASASSPCFLLLSEESYLLSMLTDKVTALFLQEERGGLTEHVFDADQLNASKESVTRFFSELGGKGMFSPKKTVVLKGLFSLKEKKIHKRLAKYIENPSSDLCLILTDRKFPVGEELKRLYGELENLETATIPVVSETETSDYIDDIAKKEKLVLPALCKTEIMEHLGTDLASIANFLETLSMYKSKSERSVTPHEIRELITDVREETVFALVDAVAQGDFDRAYRQLLTLLDDGTEPPAIIGMLFFKFRCLLLTKYAKEVRKETDANAIASMTKLAAYPVKKSLDLTKDFTFDSLKTVYLLLHEADRRFKTSSMPPRVLIENLISTLCSLRR